MDGAQAPAGVAEAAGEAGLLADEVAALHAGAVVAQAGDE